MSVVTGVDPEDFISPPESDLDVAEQSLHLNIPPRRTL
jgi:hypothetical protein